jgi:hypothetical protein
MGVATGVPKLALTGVDAALWRRNTHGGVGVGSGYRVLVHVSSWSDGGVYVSAEHD